MTPALTFEDPSIDQRLFLASPSCTSLHPRDACGVFASDGMTGINESIVRSESQGESVGVWVEHQQHDTPAVLPTFGLIGAQRAPGRGDDVLRVGHKKAIGTGTGTQTTSLPI
jgi:hypothetical protein